MHNSSKLVEDHVIIYSYCLTWLTKAAIFEANWHWQWYVYSFLVWGSRNLEVWVLLISKKENRYILALHNKRPSYILFYILIGITQCIDILKTRFIFWLFMYMFLCKNRMVYIISSIVEIDPKLLVALLKLQVSYHLRTWAYHAFENRQAIWFPLKGHSFIQLRKSDSKT